MNPWDSLASQPSLQGELQASEETLSQNTGGQHCGMTYKVVSCPPHDPARIYAPSIARVYLNPDMRACTHTRYGTPISSM